MFAQKRPLTTSLRLSLGGLGLFSLLAALVGQAEERTTAPGPILPLQKLVTTSTRGLLQLVGFGRNISYTPEVIALLRQGGWGPYEISSKGNLELELQQKSAYVADVTSGEVVFVVTDPKGLLSAGLHPEGTKLVTINRANQAQVWDTHLNKKLFSLPHKPDVALFSPKGTYVIALEKGASCGTVRIHQAHTGMELASFKAPGCLQSFEMSPDEQRVITALSDDTVRVWDPLTGKELFSLKDAEISTKSTIFSPHGKLLLTRNDYTMHIWSETGSSLVQVISPQGKILHATFSPDSERVVTAHEDHTARIWSVSGQPLQVLKGHTQAVTKAAFTEDGQRVVTAGADNTVRAWDASTGRLLYTFHKKPAVARAVFTTEGDKVAVLDESHTLTVQATQTGILFPVPNDLGEIASVRFTPDGTHLYILARNGSYYDWTFATEHAKGPWKYTYLHDQLGANQTLRNADFGFVGGIIRFVTVTEDNKAQLWSSDNPNPLVTFEDQVFLAGFNANHTQFATITQANAGHTVRFWDSWTGQSLAVLDGHTDAVQNVAFGPKGNYLATTSSDKTARVWDAKTGNLQMVLQGHTDTVRGAVFSPDDSQLLTWGEDRTARLWDVKAGTQRGIFTGEYPFVQAVFVGNSIRLLDEKQQVWEGALPTDWSVLPGLRGMYYGMPIGEVLERTFSQSTTTPITCSNGGASYHQVVDCQNFPLTNHSLVTATFVFTEGRLSMILFGITKPEGVSMADPTLKTAVQTQWTWLQQQGKEILADRKPARNAEDLFANLQKLSTDNSLTISLEKSNAGVWGTILKQEKDQMNPVFHVKIILEYNPPIFLWATGREGLRKKEPREPKFDWLNQNPKQHPRPGLNIFPGSS